MTHPRDYADDDERTELFNTICTTEERRARIALWAIAVLGAAGIMIVAGTGFTWSHDAIPTAAQPNGWTYPLACCSGVDCREVDASAIEEGPEGYVIKATGEVIPMTSRKVRPSPDGVFHLCTVNGHDDTAAICLFVPPRGF